ncbi:Crp/Fnr family transcriptional regulator [Rhizobacter sp. P5_C2]
MRAHWIDEAVEQVFRRGQAIVRAGGELADWMAIRQGAVSLHIRVAAGTEVGVAVLWGGDVIGWGSPLGQDRALYDVTALIDVVAVKVPVATVRAARDAGDRGPGDDIGRLHSATALRMQEQLALRLAGSGFQRLVNVLATFAAAFAPTQGARGLHIGLPVSQAFMGQLAGLSRRQTWIYLGQLADAGWVRTERAQVMLEAPAAWLQLPAHVEREGLECIATADDCSATLGLLCLAAASGRSGGGAVSTR